MDQLEKLAAGLGRRDAPLRDALRAVLVCLREQRAYSDSLYDTIYSLQERIEELELEQHAQGAFPADALTSEAAPAAPVAADRAESTPVEALPADCSRSGDSPPAVLVADEPCASAGGPASASGESVVETLTSRPGDNAAGEPIGAFRIEEVEAILEERQREVDARFQSIQKNDVALRQGLRQLLTTSGRRPDNVASSPRL